MNLITKIISLGVTENSKIKSKIITSNAIALLIVVLIGIPFTIISANYYPTLTFAPIIAAIVALVTIFLNYLKLDILARVMISIICSGLGLIFSASVLDMNEYPDSSLIILCFSTSFISILVFDLIKEWGWVLIINLLFVFLFINFDWINAYFEEDIDDSLIREGWFGTVLLINAFLIGFGNVIALVVINLQDEKKVTKVIKESNEQNLELKKAENELNIQLNELAEKRKIEDQNNWISNGIANFSNILRENNNDLKKLSINIIQNLIDYLDVNQGAIFVINEDSNNPSLELIAKYAYKRIKYAKSSIQLGEGLVGQCWKEKNPIHITKAPQQFINVTSGVGDPTPCFILLMPLKINEEVYGVLEIASFEQLEEYKIEFIEKISISIASTLSSVKVNIKTEKILEETQYMSEQLQTQEEELRQNAEEMLATQEEQERRIKELEWKLQSDNV